MKLKGDTRSILSQAGWAILGCLLLPLTSFGALFPVTQNSVPAGLVSQSAVIEGGQTYQSIDPQLNKNGYTFGYWAIDGVRQAGEDGRSLTRVSGVIEADSNFTAHYYEDNADTDGDGVMDWFEYRMFGDLSKNPSDDSDGDGFTTKRESELGQDALIVDFMEAGGIAGRMSNTFTYADTSMQVVTIKSDPTGFITTSITNKELNATVTTQSLNGATNGSHFAYWTINGVRQASPNGVASSKVSLNISGDTNIVAHYVPSTEDTDGDGVMDWFEFYQFGNLSAGPEDDSDGDGFSNKREGELGQEATIAEFTEAGGIAGRMSNTFTYADTSMIEVTIKSNPAGFITTSVTNKEINATVTTQSLNGATNGSHFAYWTINGVRQASPNGVASSKVSAVVTSDTEFVAHYVPSTQDTDGDGVMDWFEKYQFGNLDLGPNDDPDGDGYTNKREGELGQEATIAEFTEAGGIAGRMSNSVTYYVQQNRPPSNLELNNTIVFLNKDANQTVGTFTPTDPDDLGRVRTYTYQLLGGAGGEDNGKFNLLGRNLRTSQTLTSEGNFSIQVRVSDDENASFDKNFTIRAIDPLGDNDNDGLSYEAELAAGTNPNNPDTDGDGANDGAEVSAGKDPLDPSVFPNRPPRDLNSSTVLAFQENQPSGTIVGEFNATDPDGDAITYHFVNGENNNSLFTLDTNGTLKTATIFDYESNASTYTITVQAKDELNATTEGNFTVTLLDVYEDTDGDGFRDSLEASTGSNLNDPTSTPLQQGLVAWYPFDGNASDMSGNGNHGTVNGATLGTDRHGVAGKAYSFDGVDDFIDLNKSAYPVGLGSSLSFWINRDPSIADNTTLLLASNGNNFLRVHLFWSGVAYFDYGQGLTNPNRISFSSEATDFDQWNHWAWTRDKPSNTLTIFKNGNLLKEDNSQSLQSSGNPFDISTFRISSSSGGAYWKGILDELKIYNRALSADEIELLYRAESPNHFVDSAKDLEMIWVEPGTFTMGSPTTEAGRQTDEIEHNVTLTKGFYLGKYEVTQAQYEAVMTGNTDGLNATPSNWPNNPDRPVEKVSWDDIQKFLIRLNEQNPENLPDGWAYVLPTQAQWEYACRAGTTTAYSWGDTISAIDANWDHGNDANQTGDVGQYSPNLWGFYDMHGNVWEWTADGSDSSRRYRGGSWFSPATELRSAKTRGSNPVNRTVHIGFRLAFRQITETPTDLNSTTELTINENQPIGTIVGEFNATDPDGHAITYSLVPFSPAQVSPTLWLDASDEATLVKDSGVLSTWLDKSGNNRNGSSTGSSRPSISTGFNGYSMINLDGVDDVVSINGTFTVNTFFVVLNSGISSEKFSKWAWVLGARGPDKTPQMVPALYGRMGDSSLTTELPFQGNRQSVISINGDDTLSQGAKDFGDFSEFKLISVSSSQTSSNLSNWKISSGEFPWKGNIAEIVVFDRPLENHQRYSIEEYLSSKWGLSSKMHRPLVPSNSLFTLDTNGTLKTATTFDYETNASTYTITVQAKDELNATTEGNFTVTLINLNEPPTDLNSTTVPTITENQPVGTIVGEFNATDPDHGDKLFYRLVKDREQLGNEYFTMDENGTLYSAVSFSFDENQTFHIRVKVSDQDGLFTKESFYVSVIDAKDTGEESDKDGDGYSDKDELEQGTDPNNKFSYPNKPILQTGYSLLNEDGSIDLTGGVVDVGNGEITDFGFVLSSGISIDPKRSKVLWIRGVGEPEQFKLKLTQSPYQPVLYIRAWAKNIAGYGIGPVRKVRVPEAPKPWWGDVLERPGGWKTSGWFGNFISYEKGWLYHARLGWLYSSPASEESVWLWKENLGWLWTKEDAWPYLWSHQSGGWLYLYPGKVEETPRFYDYSSESYR